MVVNERKLGTDLTVVPLQDLEIVLYANWLAQTGDFTTKLLPVSAQRFGYDLSGWTQALGCDTWCDDRILTMPLSFTFPVAGHNATAVYPSSNGLMMLDSPGSSSYRAIDGPIDTIAPNFFSNAALRRSPMFGNSSRMLSEIFLRRSSAL